MLEGSRVLVSVVKISRLDAVARSASPRRDPGL